MPSAFKFPVLCGPSCCRLTSCLALCCVYWFGLFPVCRRLDSEMKMGLARRLDTQLNENGALQDEIDVLKRELIRLTSASSAGGSGAGADGVLCSCLQFTPPPPIAPSLR